MYLPILQLSAEADWHLRRTTTDATRTHEAALRRERALVRSLHPSRPRRRFRWLQSRPPVPATAP